MEPVYGPWPPKVKYLIDNIFYLESEGIRSIYRPDVNHKKKQEVLRRWFWIQESMKTPQIQDD